MKIRIEPLNRTAVRLADHVGVLGEPHLDKQFEKNLCLHFEKQNRKNWCWACVASIVSTFYGSNKWSQSRIAWKVLGDDFNANDDVPEKVLIDTQFNQCAQLEHVLNEVGCLGSWSGARPPFRRLMRELDLSRPVGVAVTWGRGGQHYVLIEGYNRIKRTINVLDPESGRFTIAFDFFPEQFRDGGEWAETFWTIKPKVCKN